MEVKVSLEDPNEPGYYIAQVTQTNDLTRALRRRGRLEVRKAHPMSVKEAYEICTLLLRINQIRIPDLILIPSHQISSHCLKIERGSAKDQKMLYKSLRKSVVILLLSSFLPGTHGKPKSADSMNGVCG